MTDITELAQRARINAECGEHLSPAETMELVEALESEKRICATWRKTAKSTGEKLEKAQQLIDELENDEVRQRLANAEHQLYMAELAKNNLRASRKSQFRKRRAAEKRIAELEAQNEYIRKRYQQLDLLIGKNILVMQAAIIEWQATGDAKNGLAWIYNTLFGPGELPDEAEKDAQAYFDRKYAPLDEELMALHKWFWEQSEAERAAAGIKVEDE
ncbi:TPA: ead/Ea22-like family protein [Klebsiella pneumoniae]|nr:ead/Ea22-like family protein [Klebsiella pneumoniae]HBY1126534.1 ead/Ea22-like family protein [Klebsiella pneumoniae]HBY2179454.1 ead/Ea22-like family protein [Klebsiella pneumoniae]HBY2224150.1 ead/Ea22-like family protein [Klebsiella pneumoniae]HBZ2232702.1 ead/Ea22-like family protein [Klebsiella pneumoniae]